MIAEAGVGRTTHRAVATKAGVPLGATTYYFPTLPDLIAAAFEESCRVFDAELEEWATRLDAAKNKPHEIAQLMAEYLADRDHVMLEYELYLAAARSPELQSVARTWVEQLRQVLDPHVGGAQAAHAIAVLIDGVAIQHLATGEPIDQAGLATLIETLAR